MEQVIEFCRYISSFGGRAYLAGGSVRDKLLGIEPNDYDIEVYGIPNLDEVLSNKYDVDLVGKAFGVFKVKDYNFGVSYPRTEYKIAEGHKGLKCNFDPYITTKEACGRRDFTINSMLYDPLTETYIDHYNGMLDLNNKVLRETSDAFDEDPLRVLRAFHFISRFNLTPTKSLIERCKKLTMVGIPKERVWEEFKKFITKGCYPSKGLQFLEETMWIIYFPQLQRIPINYKAIDKFGKLKGKKLEVGLSILCCYMNHQTRAFLMQMTNQISTIKYVSRLVYSIRPKYDDFRVKEYSRDIIWIDLFTVHQCIYGTSASLFNTINKYHLFPDKYK